MRAKDVVRLMQYYRHDLMNHLQIIYGYASMGNVKKVEEKTADVIQNYHLERKLMQLQATEFCLWVMENAYMYVDIKLDYDIHTEGKQIESIDQELTEQCKQIVTFVRKIKKTDEFVTINLEIKQEELHSMEILFTVNGLNNQQQLQRMLHTMEAHFPLTVSGESDAVVCSFFVPCN
ncbi:Spo0B domain-containing protein [Virgibacillus pantothenticus]|uniref:Spo0B domain-containing protein n=1 Tax=Virgibacillus pantothenticus TaxID=1473 RepID=UPI00098422DB|nr:Spo0B domain-containing protein [Virgibacillus pantothenticus]